MPYSPDSPQSNQTKTPETGTENASERKNFTPEKLKSAIMDWVANEGLELMSNVPIAFENCLDVVLPEMLDEKTDAAILDFCSTHSDEFFRTTAAGTGTFYFMDIPLYEFVSDDDYFEIKPVPIHRKNNKEYSFDQEFVSRLGEAVDRLFTRLKHENLL